MKAIAVQPEPAAAAALAKVSFVDAYGIACLAPGLTARRAAEALFTQKSVWIDALMALRNFIMRWFGVKTDAASYAPGASRIGMFPVIDEQPQQLLLGFDDRHLDFRIAVTVPARQGDAATTVSMGIKDCACIGAGAWRGHGRVLIAGAIAGMAGGRTRKAPCQKRVVGAFRLHDDVARFIWRSESRSDSRSRDTFGISRLFLGHQLSALIIHHPIDTFSDGLIKRRTLWGSHV